MLEDLTQNPDMIFLITGYGINLIILLAFLGLSLWQRRTLKKALAAQDTVKTE